MEVEAIYLVDLSGIVVWNPTEEDYERLHEQERELIGGED
jgi:hypothetical protein